ncbi:N-carbamoylputrescine amidase [Tepidamorphus gemmatus]|jgi:N-carbamoylputrescine amidase|uniref:N-carbamoylputrescine amidase n=1 Tax=Tepidamorphus gemmatus TaxID=747076 RepID=A0A4R3MKK4_9HYPH|nr:N-carbamoylputrescine amidase [Tepidamorphus gemmatus]TCT13248.1 N-carbamoylputrescine amidase [Tepidamorphus gemmatus]
MRTVTVAATQMACTDVIEENVARAETLIREAASRGANIILIQELFEGPYFCQDELPEHFSRARPAEGHPTIRRFQELAAELDVVLPVSFFERANAAHYNALAMVDAGGALLGLYRKSHIPQGPGYEEKYYFNPGDTGFRVWDTKFGRIGAGICWDQWFPECARSMALMGAEILLYPTAIGSEPIDPDWDSMPHWQTVMCGHAGANLMPLVASNRIGTEAGRKGTAITFYGSSFIADWTGQKVAEADRTSETVLTASFDLDDIAGRRAAWGIFRDRRPDLYGPLMTLDGR